MEDGPAVQERDSRAVVCASAGNLGQALAWSGRGRGLDVTVVASRFATVAKLDRIRALGARLELVDGDHEMACERAAAIALHDGIRLVEDSLDIETCEGAATIGLELVDNAPSFDTVLIALGGGALATGVGHVLKALVPDVEVICVQPLGAPAMTHSWRQRRVVTTDSTDTIADGVAGRRPIPAVHTVPPARPAHQPAAMPERLPGRTTDPATPGTFPGQGQDHGRTRQPWVSRPLRSSAARIWLSHSVPSWRPFGSWSPRSQRHVVIIASTRIRHSRSKS